MKYKHSAFIENTPEMRDWCVAYGIQSFLNDKELNDQGKYIKVFGVGQRVYSCSDIVKEVDGTDCSGNPELFKAVVMVLDGTGIYQYWTDGSKWVRSDIHDLGDIPDYLIEIGFDVKKTHKATLPELIAHFNS